MYRFTNQISFD
ncbi:tRNA-guanine transglycosylase [Streptococcus pneumoniae]|nr:tRNA-guanine transglycosylase [Streptococcus pneumoniae]